MVYKAIYYYLYFKSLFNLYKDRFIIDERAEKQAKKQIKYLKKYLINAFLNIILSGKSAVYLYREKTGNVNIL